MFDLNINNDEISDFVKINIIKLNNILNKKINTNLLYDGNAVQPWISIVLFRYMGIYYNLFHIIKHVHT